MKKIFFKQKASYFIITILIFLIIVCSASALVQVSPSSSNLSLCPNDTFSINITISGVADVYGFQFDLSYDSNVLEVVSVNEGTFINVSSQYRTFWIEPDLSTSGLIKNVVCSRLGNVSSSPPSGVLATITFRLKDAVSYPASSNFLLSNLKLSDINSNLLNNTKQDGQVTIPSCSCADGDTRSCTASNGCSGLRTCTGGAFGNCVSATPYFCDSNCDGTSECSVNNCTPCQCTGSVSRSCRTSGGCGGRTSCVNGNWSDCQITHYYCDYSCDGVNETCSDTPCPSTCVCVEHWDCDAWSTCSGGTQVRSCTDLNDCGTDDSKPSLTRTCTIGSTGGSTSGGSSSGGGSSLPPPCTEAWSCDEWSSCQTDGFSRRTCNDANNCGTSMSKPQELEICFYEGDCNDWIMNQDETGIDCGGSCPTLCPEPEPEQILAGPPQLNIIIEPVSAEILDQYVLKITVENQGEGEVNDLKIIANKWSGEPGVIQSIMPGMSEQKGLVLSLPANLDETSVDIQVVQNGVVIVVQSVPVTLSIPLFSVKINKDIETGRTYETIIVDNRNNAPRRLEIDVTINKGKETYLIDTGKTYDIGENQVFNQVDYLYQDLPAGKYDIKSVFYENGQKIGEATSFVVLGGNKKAFNVKYLFYFMLIVIVGISGYVFFMSQKK